MEKYIENDVSYLWMEKGILYILFKDNVDIFYEEARKVLADRLRLQRGRPCPICCNIRGIKHIGYDARRYNAFEGSLLIKSLALICDTPLARTFSKLYINEKLRVPTYLFTEETPALEFLKLYI
tara:strand:+ start:6191 stop:6562 length:372 start_codon:yes stop_codon:yes gene_type:complete